MKKHTSLSHHGHTGFTRHSPRNGFNGFLRALSGDRAFLSPSPAICARHIRRLDASVEASRPHDFAVRFMRDSSKAPKRPPHPALHVRDDCDTPLIARRDAAINELCLACEGSEIFFAEGLDKSATRPVVICPSSAHVQQFPLKGRGNLAIRNSAALAVDEDAHNTGGGDANGNAAFAPRLPLKPASPNWSVSPCARGSGGMNLTTGGAKANLAIPDFASLIRAHNENWFEAALKLLKSAAP